MRRSERGFTLIELLLVIGILVPVTAVVLSSIFAAARTRSLLEAASADVLAERRALSALEADLREAALVQAAPDGRITCSSSARGEAVWLLRGNVLVRTGPGGEIVRFRNVATFAVAAEGPFHRATLGFGERVPGGAKPTPAVTLVAPRPGKGER